MLFNSVHFLLFLPIVLALYYFIPRRFSNLFLLLVSYYFYISWNPPYIFLLLFSTISTYLSGILIYRLRRSSSLARRFSLWSVIVLNIGIIVYFKYSTFIIKNVNAILSYIGDIQIPLPGENILLPLGISFYTFQALGYLIDIYKGIVVAEKNFIKYALFVS